MSIAALDFCLFQYIPTVVFNAICSYLSIVEKLVNVIRLSRTSEKWLNNPSCLSTNHLHLHDVLVKELKSRPKLSLQLSSISSLSIFSQSAIVFDYLSVFSHLSYLEALDGDSDFDLSICSQLVHHKPLFFQTLVHFSFSLVYTLAHDRHCTILFSTNIFPRLSSVHFSLIQQQLSTREEQQLISLLHLPSLTSLIINSTQNITPILLSNINWGQVQKIIFIAHIHTSTIHCDEFLFILFMDLQSSFHNVALRSLHLHGSIKITEHGFRLLAALPSLITLDLRNSSFEYQDEFDSLHPSTTTTSDPIDTHSYKHDQNRLFPSLRHLLLPRLLCRTRKQRILFSHLLQFFIHQLTVLDWALWRDERKRNSQQQRPGPLQQVFRMTELHKLALGCRFDPFTQEETHRMIQSLELINLRCLHTLVLDMVQLMLPSLTLILRCTQELRDLSIHESGLSIRTLPAIANLCPYIRSIKMTGKWSNPIIDPEPLTISQSSSSSTSLSLPFTCLQVIELEMDPICPNLRSIVGACIQMLSKSPLQYIRIKKYRFTCEELLMFDFFSQLRSLIVDNSSVLDVHHQCNHGIIMSHHPMYTIALLSVDLDIIDHSEELPTIQELVERKERHEQQVFLLGFRLSVVSGHQAADRQGREAFFHDLRHHIQAECIEKRS